MEKAERFLGRRYCIEGNVVKGLQNGRKMGIPTANVDYDVNMALPEEGVYAGITCAWKAFEMRCQCRKKSDIRCKKIDSGKSHP